MSSQQQKQLTWLITGCSTGFGAEFIPSILARGDKVIATARGDLARLKPLEVLGAKILSLDVTAPEAELEKIIKEAIDLAGGTGIDVLVNNAGYVNGALVEEVSIEKFRALVDTNFWGSVNVTRAMIPHFRSKRSGTIAFVGSFTGWVSFPGSVSYVSSKFALEGFAETVQAELAPFNVRSIIFEPGFARTPLFEPAKFEDKPLPLVRQIADYDQIRPLLIPSVYHNTQPGDSKKMVERMVDVVRGEGLAAGRSFPKRLPLGSDSLAAIRKKCQETLELCDEWENVIVSTDIESTT